MHIHDLKYQIQSFPAEILQMITIINGNINNVSSPLKIEVVTLISNFMVLRFKHDSMVCL